MFSSYKKTHWIIFVFLFVLVLTVTMVVYFDLTSVFQREAKTVVTAPINIEKTKSIQPNSNNSNVIISERPDTEVARSEEIDIELNRVIVPAEPNISNIETLCSEEIDIGQDNAIISAETHISETDKYINNPAIDRFNETTAKLTDNKTIFYLDANILFDDENGNLAKEKSSDSAHLKAKYCVQWAEWLDIETTELILQAEGEKGDG